MAWDLSKIENAGGKDLSETLDAISLRFSKLDKNADSLGANAGIDEWEDIIDAFHEQLGKIQKLSTYNNLIGLLDSSDEQAVANLQKVQRLKPITQRIRNKLIVAVDDAILTAFANTEYEAYIKFLIKQKPHTASPEQERLLASIPSFASGAWASLHRSFLHGIKKPAPAGSLAKAQSMQLDQSPEIRKRGYERELKICEAAAKVSAYALNGIKAETELTAKIRGHASVLDMCLYEDGIGESFLLDALQATKKVLPRLRECLRHKARKAGSDTVKWYDMLFSTRRELPALAYGTAIEIAERAFGAFSPCAGAVVVRAQNEGFIDCEKRKNKRNGACCNTVYEGDESYVMLTFTGAYKNFISLAHELGHGYHHMLLNRNPFRYSFAPMPIGEMVAIFMEMLAADKLAEADGVYRETVLEGRIDGFVSSFMDVHSRFLFERKFFDIREKEGFLSAGKLCAMMKEAQTEIYGDTGDEETYHPYNWVAKPHFYYADTPFYNYPYMLGRLGALWLYARHKEEGRTFAVELENVLQAGGRYDAGETLEKLGILKSNANWKKSTDILNGFIDAYLAV
jgi:oligoendopeptidase F